MFRTEEEDMVLSEKRKSLAVSLKSFEKLGVERRIPDQGWKESERIRSEPVSFERERRNLPLSPSHIHHGATGKSKREGERSVPRPGAREKERGGESVGDC